MTSVFGSFLDKRRLQSSRSRTVDLLAPATTRATCGSTTWPTPATGSRPPPPWPTTSPRPVLDVDGLDRPAAPGPAPRARRRRGLPAASTEGYENRLEGPWRAALPWTPPLDPDDPCPPAAVRGPRQPRLVRRADRVPPHVRPGPVDRRLANTQTRSYFAVPCRTTGGCGASTSSRTPSSTAAARLLRVGGRRALPGGRPRHPLPRRCRRGPSSSASPEAYRNLAYFEKAVLAPTRPAAHPRRATSTTTQKSTRGGKPRSCCRCSPSLRSGTRASWWCRHWRRSPLLWTVQFGLRSLGAAPGSLRRRGRELGVDLMGGVFRNSLSLLNCPRAVRRVVRLRPDAPVGPPPPRRYGFKVLFALHLAPSWRPSPGWGWPPSPSPACVRRRWPFAVIAAVAATVLGAVVGSLVVGAHYRAAIAIPGVHTHPQRGLRRCPAPPATGTSCGCTSRGRADDLRHRHPPLGQAPSPLLTSPPTRVTTPPWIEPVSPADGTPHLIADVVSRTGAGASPSPQAWPPRADPDAQTAVGHEALAPGDSHGRRPIADAQLTVDVARVGADSRTPRRAAATSPGSGPRPARPAARPPAGQAEVGTGQLPSRSSGHPEVAGHP